MYITIFNYLVGTQYQYWPQENIFEGYLQNLTLKSSQYRYKYLSLPVMTYQKIKDTNAKLDQSQYDQGKSIQQRVCNRVRCFQEYFIDVLFPVINAQISINIKPSLK